MRFIIGVIVGCLLTVGAAYVHDAGTSDTVTEAAAVDVSGRMVNWAVVNHELSGLNGWVHSQWAWISGKLNKAG